jgi:HipA-like protein
MGFLFKKLIGLLPSDQKAQSDKINAIFEVRHGSVTIGILRYTEAHWYFNYTDEFKLQSSLNVISDFPDKSRMYISDVLWPFFAVRIPGLKQPRVIELMEKSNISADNQVALLREFGKNTVANPYQLVAIEY